MTATTNKIREELTNFEKEFRVLINNPQNSDNPFIEAILKNVKCPTDSDKALEVKRESIFGMFIMLSALIFFILLFIRTMCRAKKVRSRFGYVFFCFCYTPMLFIRDFGVGYLFGSYLAGKNMIELGYLSLFSNIFSPIVILLFSLFLKRSYLFNALSFILFVAMACLVSNVNPIKMEAIDYKYISSVWGASFMVENISFLFFRWLFQ